MDAKGKSFLVFQENSVVADAVVNEEEIEKAHDVATALKNLNADWNYKKSQIKAALKRLLKENKKWAMSRSERVDFVDTLDLRV